jgi:hypothetical protein
MAQADQIVQNDTFPAFRADLNNNLAALFSDNSGTVAPTPTVAFMDWIDTSGVDPVWRKRNAANNAWIAVATFSGSSLLVAAVSTTALGSGTANSGTFLRGDRSWQAVPPGLLVSSTAQAQAGTDDTTAISPLKLRQGFNASGTAPVYACRAWVNFNGTNASIRSNGNVSSVTRGATGLYTVNFTTAMPDANHAIASLSGGHGQSGGASVSVSFVEGVASVASGSVTFRNSTEGGVAIDNNYISFVVFR